MDSVDINSFFAQRSSVRAWDEAEAVSGGDASAYARDIVTISAQAKEVIAKQEAPVNSAVTADEVFEEQSGSGGTTFADQF